MSGLLTGSPLRRPADTTREAPDAGALNRLRAGILGANDGIVSVAAIVVGVAGATMHSGTILAAGLAALIGGAISMALGEYVSVAGQRDSQRAAGSRTAVAGQPDGGAAGVDDEASPWAAAWASFAAFGVGGVLPLLAMVLLPAGPRIPVSVVVVVAALAATGAAGARLGGAPVRRATLRVVVGGLIALAVTFTIGHLLGTGLLG